MMVHPWDFRRLGRLIGALALLPSFIACGSLENVTSGHIGCPETDITITDDESGWNTRSWTAHCHGKTYFCSLVGGQSSQVSCQEAQQSAAEAPPAKGGCQSDGQCKGDRICRSGVCVDP
jgi:hypothetical protein